MRNFFPSTVATRGSIVNASEHICNRKSRSPGFRITTLSPSLPNLQESVICRTRNLQCIADLPDTDTEILAELLRHLHLRIIRRNLRPSALSPSRPRSFQAGLSKLLDQLRQSRLQITGASATPPEIRSIAYKKDPRHPLRERCLQAGPFLPESHNGLRPPADILFGRIPRHECFS